MSLLSLFTPLEKGQQHFVSVSYESLTGQGTILVPSRFGSRVQKRAPLGAFSVCDSREKC